jgi:2-phospho-L-lactate guanylyltransferase
MRTVKSTTGIHQIVLVSKAPEVFHVAKKFEAIYLKESKTGLNEAVSEAIDWCIEKDVASVLILPADIPLVTPMDLNRMLALRETASMVISPSRSGKGTNAILLTPPNVCETFYGPCSFQRHIEEASKRRISICKFRSQRIALDVDTIKDLVNFISKNGRETSAYKLLDEIGIASRLINAYKPHTI